MSNGQSSSDYEKMSVDVFGRQLTSRHGVKSVSGGRGSRGPPGNGFNITADGQYDIDNKRLCNVANPTEQNDAVTVQVMQSAVQQEIRLVYQITSSLRSNVDDHDTMIYALQSELANKLKKQVIDFETVQELITRNSELITHLDDRLRAFERSGANEENKSMIRGLESSINEQFKRFETYNETGQALTLRNSEVIANLDTRLRGLENERGKGNIGGGTS